MSKTKAKRARAANGDGAEQRDLHPDAEILARLVKKVGSGRAVAAELDIEPQAFSNWMTRGIATAKRGEVYKLAKKHRCAPPLEWLTG
jgi:hypothetical protein